ncbi:hypothetical protein I302_107794 [Kwoniella bestiolae CBS 10118]|uniref:Uncharacterized protein n=1 Tax=Kwoniella bestiolae CBS 10118 TaxID=1296100 RepID=A0A1B9FXJ5_9TREE|nr:hypothetical protein I302_06467 [Kwoniella bestiolae CBS 10118]OCF23485.1 hypothetical protein I302_06467 [Kwoniella bestiolae CBS 10118]
MFPTSRNHQRTVNAARAYQHESPPATGGEDSCYGVKSVSSWGEQSEVEVNMPGPSTALESEYKDMHTKERGSYNDDDDEDQGEDDSQGDSTPEGNDSMASSSVGLGLGINNEDGAVHIDQALSPSRPIHTRPEQRIVPPSPEDTVHPLDHRDDGSPSSRRHQPLTLEHITRSFDSPFLPTTSEPSSPASFTSMPSYVASLSSLSRTSSISPMGIHEYNQQLAHGGLVDELVLPTLALPSESLSLHMSLNKWSDEEGGLGVILLGEREEVQRCLRRLREKEELVEIQSGVGVVREGKIALRIITGYKSIEQARNRVLHTYNTLNALLHPQLRDDTSSRGELRRLVEGYIGRSDWIHTVVSLRGSDDVTCLEDLIPAIQSNPRFSPTIETTESWKSTAKTPSLRSTELVEPTPRPSDETSEYFAPRAYSPSPSSSKDYSPVRSIEQGDQAVSQLIDLVDSPSACTGKSIDTFLSWRANQHTDRPIHLTSPVPSLFDITGQGERTMASSLTSTSSGVGAMPTVARAQGGGEWEATLSRRVAQRRESDSGRDKSTVSLRGRGTSRRRRSLEKIKDCSPLPPLFPRNKKGKGVSVSDKGLGVNELVDKTFMRSVKKWTRGWRGLLVVGLVVAVGWGCWVSRKGVV